jgi:hypothetical protein
MTWINTSSTGGRWIGLLVVGLLLAGCGAHRIQPRAPGDWVVELVELQVGASDFHVSRRGQALDLAVRVLEDGTALKASGPERLSGRRGQRILDQPMAWLIRYDPQRTYQVLVVEKGFASRRAKWERPPTPRLNEWPFAGKDGLLPFGKESYLKFRVRRIDD